MTKNIKLNSKISDSDKNSKHSFYEKPSKRLKNSLGIFIAIFSFTLYAQSISFKYVQDDFAVLKENRFVMQGFKGVPEILKHDHWYGAINATRIPQYRPLTLVFFAIAWQCFPDNPSIYHFLNVLLDIYTTFPEESH